MVGRDRQKQHTSGTARDAHLPTRFLPDTILSSASSNPLFTSSLFPLLPVSVFSLQLAVLV